MSRVDRDRAAASLAAAGIAPDIADLLLSTDRVIAVCGQVVTVIEERDPLTGEIGVLVPVGADLVATDDAALAELAEWARAHLGATRLMLHLQTSTRPTSGNPYLRYVRATSRIPAADEPTAGWTLRPTARSDADTVVELLATALTDAHAELPCPTPPDPVALGNEAAALFDASMSAGWGFVAHHDGEFAGHATVFADRDELTLRRRWELFDMFVLPAHRGGPAARLLTGAVTARARRSHRPLRGHVAGSGEASDTVYRRLLDSGWRRDTTYWTVPLDDGACLGYAEPIPRPGVPA